MSAEYFLDSENVVLVSSWGRVFFLPYFLDIVCYLSKDITDVYLPKFSVNAVVCVPTKLYWLVFISHLW